jgi:WD40 repeat protein
MSSPPRPQTFPMDSHAVQNHSPSQRSPSQNEEKDPVSEDDRDRSKSLPQSRRRRSISTSPSLKRSTSRSRSPSRIRRGGRSRISTSPPIQSREKVELARGPPPARLNYQLAYTMGGHKGPVSAVKFSPDGTKIASCCAFAHGIIA